MHLQLKKWRRVSMNPDSLALIIPWQDLDPVNNKILQKGHVRFSKIGEVQEVPDSVGYGILRSHSDMLQQVTLQKTAPNTKRAAASQNK